MVLLRSYGIPGIYLVNTYARYIHVYTRYSAKACYPFIGSKKAWSDTQEADPAALAQLASQQGGSGAVNSHSVYNESTRSSMSKTGSV